MAARVTSQKSRKKSSVAWLTAISLTAISAFAILIIVLHFLRPDLDPIHRPTSEYAVGEFSYLMTTAFFCMSIATFALVVSLNKTIGRKAKSLIGLIFLTVWAVAVLVALSFPIDPEGAPTTTAGRIHQTNGPIAFLSLTIGVFLVSIRFKHDENMRSLYHTALILSLIMLLLFISVAVSLSIGLGLEGIFQRIYLIVVIVWFILVLIRIRKNNIKN